VLRINPDILKDLEAWAADEFRSTNGQIEYLLQQAVNAGAGTESGGRGGYAQGSVKSRDHKFEEIAT